MEQLVPPSSPLPSSNNNKIILILTLIIVNPEVDNTSTHSQETAHSENASVELNPDDIVADPGLRKPIEELDVNITNAAVTHYLLMDPCQLVNHKFPAKLITCQMQ
jgi:hypothetical protein